MSIYADDVYSALGVCNAFELSRKYKCPLIYFFTHHPHAFGNSDHRAEIHFYRNGLWWKARPIRVEQNRDTLKRSRAAHLAAAIEQAEQKGLGVRKWVPSGYPDAWIPETVKKEVTTELKKWRKEQAIANGRDDRQE